MKKIHVAVLFAFAMQNVHAQSWNTVGNNNITTSNFLGTTNSKNLVFKTNNIERGRLSSAGVWRFGCGPVVVQVDATGKLKVGAYTFPSTDGTNGQVLKTNGAGILSWSDASNNGGGANLSLSNLSSTAINQSLLPGTDNTNDLGSPNFSWKDIYLSDLHSKGNATFNGTLKVGAYTFPSTDGTSGQVLKTNGSGVLIWSDESNNGGGGANLSLSNLSSTAVNQSLFPDQNNSRDLGSSNLSWKDIYFNGAIYLNGERFLWKPPGQANVAVGESTLSSNTGNANIAIGWSSLLNNASGSSNVAIGAHSLSNNITGNLNTATGVSSLMSNTTGDNNTATGAQSLVFNTTGVWNTAQGMQVLFNNKTGSLNTAVGYLALFNNVTSNENTAIGFGADVVADGLTNATAIGARATVDASNKVRIGDEVVHSIGGQVGWTTFSDGRYKKNIKENVPGLAFVNSLRPVTYSVDVNSLNSYYSKGKKQTSSDLKESESLKRSADEASKIIQTGFVAQEVEAAANKLGYDFNGVDKPKNKEAVYGLRYDQFVVPLVKAVQELSKANDAKNAKIDAQQKRIEDLENKLSRFETMLSQCCASQAAQSSSSQSVILNNNDAASLQQNIPNPFNTTTIISYTLPHKFSSAQIVITDKSGKVLKQLKVQDTGKGMVQVDASTLASGAYNYSLYVDGKLIASKQMVLTK